MKKIILNIIFLIMSVLSYGQGIYYASGQITRTSSINISNLSISSSVTNIGASAIYYCNNITSIKIHPNNTVYDSRNNCNAIIETSTNTLIKGCNTTVIPLGVTSISGYAFGGCTGLTSITIPDSVTNIDYSAFSGCSGLTSISIPDSVTHIGGLAFLSCASLVSVNLSNNITILNNSLFDGCSSLTAITIPNGVTSIGDYAFSGCLNLTSVIIPDSVTRIGILAFRDCKSTSLSIICNPITPPTLGNRVFEYTSASSRIYVPAQSVDTYKATSGWKTYASRIYAIQ